jgi:hypothetical protein
MKGDLVVGPQKIVNSKSRGHNRKSVGSEHFSNFNYFLSDLAIVPQK